jgi:hypothetical protein
LIVDLIHASLQVGVERKLCSSLWPFFAIVISMNVEATFFVAQLLSLWLHHTIGYLTYLTLGGNVGHCTRSVEARSTILIPTVEVNIIMLHVKFEDWLSIFISSKGRIGVQKFGVQNRGVLKYLDLALTFSLQEAGNGNTLLVSTPLTTSFPPLLSIQISYCGAKGIGFTC